MRYKEKKSILEGVVVLHLQQLGKSVYLGVGLFKIGRCNLRKFSQNRRDLIKQKQYLDLNGKVPTNHRFGGETLLLLFLIFVDPTTDMVPILK